MADEENKDASDEGNLRVDIATLFTELRIAVEALAVGTKGLLLKPEAALIKEDLGILAMLAHRSAEVVAAVTTALEGLFKRRG